MEDLFAVVKHQKETSMNWMRYNVLIRLVSSALFTTKARINLYGLTTQYFVRATQEGRRKSKSAAIKAQTNSRFEFKNRNIKYHLLFVMLP